MSLMANELWSFFATLGHPVCEWGVARGCAGRLVRCYFVRTLDITHMVLRKSAFLRTYTIYNFFLVIFYSFL
jgi:hypothetical protein